MLLGASRSSTPRSRGPRARSNGRAASSAARRRRFLARGLGQRRQIHQRQNEAGGRLDTCRLAPSWRRRCAAPRGGARSRPGSVAAPRVARAFAAQRLRHVVERIRAPGGRGTRAALGEGEGQVPRPAARRGERERPAPAPRRASIRAARRATVGASKRARTCSSTPKAARRREITCVASSEWPPRSKKSPSSPTRSSPSTAPRGLPPSPRRACAAPASLLALRLGRRQGLAVDLAVGGERQGSTVTKADGTMDSGSRSRKEGRSSSIPASPTT